MHTNKEAEVLGLIKEIEHPLFLAVQAEYGADYGRRVCGPASIALSRVISHRLQIPIGRVIRGEHLEVAMGIYDPRPRPDAWYQMEEQTYIRYFPGDDNAYFIDPVSDRFLSPKANLLGAIEVQRYPKATLEADLVRNHDLYPFDPRHPHIEELDITSGLEHPDLRAQYWENLVSAMNDDRATMGMFVGDSGELLQTNWDKIPQIIRGFAPNWQPSPLIVGHQRMLLEALSHLEIPIDFEATLRSSVEQILAKGQEPISA